PRQRLSQLICRAGSGIGSNGIPGSIPAPRVKARLGPTAPEPRAATRLEREHLPRNLTWRVLVPPSALTHRRECRVASQQKFAIDRRMTDKTKSAVDAKRPKRRLAWHVELTTKRVSSPNWRAGATN